MIGELESLCRGINDVINMVNTSEKVGIKLELQQKLSEMMTNSLGVQVKMQEMLDENKSLKQQIEELQKVKITEEDIEYHEYPYITLKSDKERTRKFCANCWAELHILFQLGNTMNPCIHYCSRCKTSIRTSKR